MAEYEVFNPEENNNQEPKRRQTPHIKTIVSIIIIILIGIYLSTGVYQVGSSEVALVKTFGKYQTTQGPGIHIHAPIPFQSHVIVDTRSVKKVEIGFRTTRGGSNPTYSTLDQESNMITGDENILHIEAVVQYRIRDPEKAAFRIIDDYDLVKFTTESILRERVALSNIDDVLTAERDSIAMKTAELVQETLDLYDSGIMVESVFLQDVTPPDSVVAAFDDVNNAKQDREKIINEANRYSNDILPRAEGEAEQILRQAESYAFEQVADAEGETQRFLAILDEYKNSEDVTRKRLILDAINDMLQSSKIKVISENDSTLKLLNLDQILGGDSKWKK